MKEMAADGEDACGSFPPALVKGIQLKEDRLKAQAATSG